MEIDFGQVPNTWTCGFNFERLGGEGKLIIKYTCKTAAGLLCIILIISELFFARGTSSDASKNLSSRTEDESHARG